MNEYKIEYLQTFKDDLNDIVRYITLKLDNRPASHKLIDDVQKKIELLKANPEIYQYYDFVKPLKRKYRYFVVGNFITFYSVDKKSRVVTIYRILYSKQNINSAMK